MRLFVMSWILAAILAVNLMLTGCSFGVQIGYHGQSGVDNREASSLTQPKAK